MPDNEEQDLFAKTEANPVNPNLIAQKSEHAPQEEAKQEKRLENRNSAVAGDIQPEETRASEPLLPEDRRRLSCESSELSEPY